MKKFLALTTLLVVSSHLFAAPAITVKNPNFSPVDWMSKGSSDVITINNGTGSRLAIFIQTRATDLMGNPVDGIEVRNCGLTTHIDAGSSVVCHAGDAFNPVRFYADGKSVGGYALGTYQVEQRQ